MGKVKAKYMEMIEGGCSWCGDARIMPRVQDLGDGPKIYCEACAAGIKFDNEEYHGQSEIKNNRNAACH